MNLNRAIICGSRLYTLAVIILLNFSFLVGCSNTTSGEETKKFKIVSVFRVNTIDSHSAGNRAFYWGKDKQSSGVVIILKSLNSESITMFSTDFSLGYKDEGGIPRSPCIGLSFGVTNPDNIIKSTWMLGGSISRTWASKDKPYFGVLFEAPKKSKSFDLFYANPLFDNLQVK